MLDKIANNPNLRYFLLYSLTFIFYGCVIAAPGPLIPFLANKHDKLETDFTYLFACRAVGFIVGSILMNLTVDKFNNHFLLIISLVFAGVPFIIFPFTDSMVLEGVYIFISSICCSCFEILINICLLATHKNNNEEFWLQILHGIFGIGGLIGPLFIGVGGVYGCIWIGGALLIGIPGYFLLPSPETFPK